jgi:hypothetical protein
LVHKDQFYGQEERIIKTGNGWSQDWLTRTKVSRLCSFFSRSEQFSRKEVTTLDVGKKRLHR